MTTFKSFSELSAQMGQEISVTPWRTIDQEQVNLFAQATGDHQWIHVDPQRAAQGPFGTTVAHGFFTLSLLAVFLYEACEVEGVTMGLNYGLNKVRFTSPVPVGSRLRARVVLLNAEPLENQGMQLTWQVTIEREGQSKPVCIAEALTRMYGAAA